METDLNLVNLSVDLNGKDLQRCTTNMGTYKTVLYFNGSMDPNLETLHVDSYDKNLQSCTTEVETFKLFFSNSWMACLSINFVFIFVLSRNATLMSRMTRNCKVCTICMWKPQEARNDFKLAS